MIFASSKRLLSVLVCVLVVTGGFGSKSWPDQPHTADRPGGLPTSDPNSLGMDATSLDAIDDLVERGISEHKMPGAVVMIGYRGSVVFHRAYGHRQLVPEPLPMEPDTLFDLASLTKPIATATSVMILVDQGAVELQAPVAKYLPEFDNHDKGEITVEDLLLHVGGLIPDNAMADYQDGAEAATERLMNIDLNYQPGERFRYSDVGFMVLGELVQRVSGKNINEFSHESIFPPLGMSETGYLPPEPSKTGGDDRAA